MLKCAYCSNHKVDGHDVALFDVRKTVDQMEKLQQLPNTRGFEIVDGVFNLPLPHALDVCRQMRQRQVKLPWTCMLNIGAVTEELAQLMGETGCMRVDFGTDACSDPVLRRLNKTYTKQDIVNAHNIIAAQESIGIMHCIFIGSPGETRASVFESLELMDRLVPNQADVNNFVYFSLGMRIWEGTRLYDIALEDGVIQRQDDMSFPHFYIAPNILRDDQLLDEIEAFIVAHENWYLWWGLPNCSLRQRIRQVTEEYHNTQQLFQQHMHSGAKSWTPSSSPAATG
jgi:radical SAM superfamily enzyme YgiQ (UPF0313 family)